MPHNCCVPQCFSNSKKNTDLMFHRFPKKKQLKKQWISKIGRDEGPSFVVNDNTRACSKHFTKDDYTPRSCRKTKSSTEGRSSEVPSKKRRKCCSKCEEKQNTIHSLQSYVDNKNTVINDLRETIADLMDKLESEKSDLQSQLSQKSHHTCFSAECFESDDKAIRHHTGVYNWQVFRHLFEFLKERTTHLNYWRSARDAEKHFAYDVKHKKRQGRPRYLKVIDELFLTLVHSRHDFTLRHLSFLFKISTATASRVFLTWINFLYLEFGAIPIWQSRILNDEAMPVAFKEKYFNTRCILDCTEIKINKPSSLRAQSQCFSSYKKTNAAKGLLGIAPSGAPVFISKLYDGSISDRDNKKQNKKVEF
ncbi:uncharacterized protein LOC116292366 [Actinia tenebrosa]|uniref:Uncharacterized protein LOC116292366 n=1 Tax=Actinia tenebrosa TaxID=6105 RepID=A0A6P8HS91_ACTTE|nr:uncharacterized protein LOC116292366 [Actinia tenebrosa]